MPDKVETIRTGRRVSDAELTQLREDLTVHIVEFREHMAEEHQDRKAQHDAQMRNAKAIEDLTAIVTKQVEATAPFIAFSDEVSSAAKLGTRVGDLFVWLAKFGTVGAAIIFVGQWALEHLPRQ